MKLKMQDTNLLITPKVLTIWQPWALLFAHGIKQYETRPKPTSYKGTYLIHAAKAMNRIQKNICNEEFFADALTNLGIKSYKELERGVILGAYEQEICIPVKEIITKLSQQERAFGDYSPGRFVWKGIDHRIVENPIPYTNGQGYYRSYKGDMELIKSLI